MTHGYDGYIRVSRVGGRSGDNFISPDVQRDSILRYADLKGIEILEWHEDLDQSGAKIRRPALDTLMQRIEARETGGVIVAKLDRFGRSLTNSLQLIAQIDDVGADFVSVADNFDSSTPTGRLVLNMMLSLAQFELDRIRENWNTARSRAVERGVHIASRCPTGYMRGDDGRLVPHPTDGPLIGDLFRMKAGGCSWNELAAFLNTNGVVGPYSAPIWTQRACSHILSNRVYLGEARSGSMVNLTAHAPLIDELTWKAAQRMKAPAPSRGGTPSLLTGFIRCSGCRHLMKPDRMTLRDGSYERIYRCRGKHSSGTCQARPSVLARIIEPFVVDAFLSEVAGYTAEAAGVDLTDLERAVADAHSELITFRDNERIAALGDVYTDGLSIRAKTFRDLEAELEAERRKLRPSGMPDATEVREIWPELEIAEQRKLLMSLYDCIVLRRVGQANVPIASRVLFVARGEAPADLPRRGKRFPFRPWPTDDPAFAGPVAKNL